MAGASQQATASGELPPQTYVTFPSSESKIFTLSQGHLAVTALSQAGSGWNTVNGGAWEWRELLWGSKINGAAGGCCWEWGAPGRCSQGRMGLGWQQGLQWQNRARTWGQGKNIHRVWTDMPSTPPATLPTAPHAAPACSVPEAVATPTSLLYLPSRSCWKYSSCSS